MKTTREMIKVNGDEYSNYCDNVPDEIFYLQWVRHGMQRRWLAPVSEIVKFHEKHPDATVFQYNELEHDKSPLQEYYISLDAGDCAETAVFVGSKGHFILISRDCFSLENNDSVDPEDRYAYRGESEIDIAVTELFKGDHPKIIFASNDMSEDAHAIVWFFSVSQSGGSMLIIHDEDLYNEIQDADPSWVESIVDRYLKNRREQGYEPKEIATYPYTYVYR